MNLRLLMLISQALSVVPAGQVAKADQPDVQLFMALASASKQRMVDFSIWDIANTA